MSHLIGTVALSVLMTFSPRARGDLLIAQCSASAAHKISSIRSASMLVDLMRHGTFANPFIFPIISSDHYNQIVTRRIKGVE